MALQSSGQISLDDIHVEAGGTSGTYATINDSDIRGLIGASSASEMEFADFYGASSSASFVGAVLRDEPNEGDMDSSSEAIDVVSAGVQVGDLVVIAITADVGRYETMAIQGMSMTKFFDSGNDTPASLVFYGVWASGNSNPYLDGSDGTYSATGRLRAMSSVTGIFRNTSSSLLTSNTESGSSGMPDPDSIGVSYSANRSIIICTGHLDDDEVFMTAPSGFTMAGASKTNSTSRDGFTGSSTGMCYKITTSSASEYINAFGGSGSDAHDATAMRF